MQTSTPSAEVIAKNLINHLFEENEEPLERSLQHMRTRKNPHHKKFSNHLSNLIKKLNPQLSQSFNAFIRIGNIGGKINCTEAQILSIWNGFQSYWNTQNKKQLKKCIIEGYFQFPCCVCGEAGKLLKECFPKYNKSDKQYFKDIVLSRLVPTSPKYLEHCLSLIVQLQLLCLFKIDQIVHIMIQLNQEYIYKLFPSNNLNMQLIDAYILQMKDTHKIKWLLNKWNLNPRNYPSYLQKLHKNCLRYLLTQQPIQMIQLKINKPSLMEELVKVLDELNRKDEANYIAYKYSISYSGVKPTSTANKLLIRDKFAPTEQIFYGDSSFLSLAKFGYNFDDLTFFNAQNMDYKVMRSILSHDKIGIDSESPFVWDCYEPRSTALLQLATSTKMYLFDLISLKGKKQFKQWFIKLITQFKGIIVGHTVETDIKELIKELSLEVKVKVRLVDVAKEYKLIKPNANRMSLKHIVQDLLKEKISKMEQCSAWNNRPLRYCQMHYAALDAVLPIKLYDAMN